MIITTPRRHKSSENTQDIFITSRQKLLLAKDMMRDENSFMSAEYGYFDENFKKMKSFVTLTARVYHPLLCKQIVLEKCSVNRRTKKILKFSLAYSIKPTRKCMVTMKSSFQLACALIVSKNFIDLVKMCIIYIKETVKGC